MRLAYIGNFGPPFSTENDILDELQRLGHDVEQIQEGGPVEGDRFEGINAVLWTSTKGLADQWPQRLQRWVLYQLRSRNIPTIAIHLDRWWGLSRWENVLDEPWFQCDYVFTADGAHDKEFAAAGVNHFWMPPAIATRHTEYQGQVRREFQHDIAFVGNHFAGHYHPEWTHRPELIKWLNRHYRGRVGFYPRSVRGRIDPRIEGNDKADLYVSAKVVIGDSCLVPTVDGQPMHHYCSDRVFDTIGRGGLLLHPLVEGVIGRSGSGELLESGRDCMAWELGNWQELKKRIDDAVALPDVYREIAEQGRRRVVAHHTYKRRLLDIFAQVGLS